MDPGHIIFLLPWRPAKQNVRDAGGFSSQYMAKSKAIFRSISSCLVSLMRSKSLLAGNNNFVRLYDYFVACVQVFQFEGLLSDFRGSYFQMSCSREIMTATKRKVKSTVTLAFKN